MKKNLIVLVVVAVVSLAFSFSAGACTIIGTIKATYATATGQYIDVAPSTTASLPAYVYRYFVPNSYAGIQSSVASATSVNRTVQAFSGTSCPTSGSLRSVGTITQLNLLMNY